ncbi:MAG TPA: hypothetical protein VHH33_02565 [Nitrososphaeraceae archaeon]|nr:hypothetical protein [Nitrososphaeraceae archaeon]
MGDYFTALSGNEDILTVVNAIIDARESREEVRQIVMELRGGCN